MFELKSVLMMLIFCPSYELAIDSIQRHNELRSLDNELNDLIFDVSTPEHCNRNYDLYMKPKQQPN